jgi:hypothetical protein
LIVSGSGNDRRLQTLAGKTVLQCAVTKQLLVRANSIRRVVDFASVALVDGARVI